MEGDQVVRTVVVLIVPCHQSLTMRERRENIQDWKLIRDFQTSIRLTLNNNLTFKCYF